MGGIDSYVVVAAATSVIPAAIGREPSWSFAPSSFSSTPTHPAGKQQWLFSGTKGADPQADTALGLPLATVSASHLCGPAPHSHPQQKQGWDSGEDQPLTCRAAWPGIAPVPQPPGQGTSLCHLMPAVARPSIPVTVTSDRAMAPAKTTKLVPFLTQPAPNESEREQPLD